jgi:hypothetical protein
MKALFRGRGIIRPSQNHEDLSLEYFDSALQLLLKPGEALNGEEPGAGTKRSE